jgi:hypothetical protein
MPGIAFYSWCFGIYVNIQGPVRLYSSVKLFSFLTDLWTMAPSGPRYNVLGAGRADEGFGFSPRNLPDMKRGYSILQGPRNVLQEGRDRPHSVSAALALQRSADITDVIDFQASLLHKNIHAISSECSNAKFMAIVTRRWPLVATPPGLPEAKRTSPW